MSTKICMILIASIVILILTSHFGPKPEQFGSGPAVVASSLTASCQSSIEPNYIQMLSSRTEEANQSALKLLDFAKESVECRNAVINAVIAALKNADLENDDSAIRLWKRGSTILGRLKAVEALDLLIAHLDLNDGLFSASMVHEPVVVAMELMGEVAVPKLAIALKTSPKTRIRLAAAFCLSTIGNSEALEALNSALTTETKECVRRLITLLLVDPHRPANSSQPLTSKDGEILRQRLQAYACNS